MPCDRRSLRAHLERQRDEVHHGKKSSATANKCRGFPYDDADPLTENDDISTTIFKMRTSKHGVALSAFLSKCEEAPSARLCEEHASELECLCASVLENRDAAAVLHACRWLWVQSNCHATMGSINSPKGMVSSKSDGKLFASVAEACPELGIRVGTQTKRHPYGQIVFAKAFFSQHDDVFLVQELGSGNFSVFLCAVPAFRVSPLRLHISQVMHDRHANQEILPSAIPEDVMESFGEYVLVPSQRPHGQPLWKKLDGSGSFIRVGFTQGSMQSGYFGTMARWHIGTIQSECNLASLPRGTGGLPRGLSPSELPLPHEVECWRYRDGEDGHSMARYVPVRIAITVLEEGTRNVVTLHVENNAEGSIIIAGVDIGGNKVAHVKGESIRRKPVSVLRYLIAQQMQVLASNLVLILPDGILCESSNDDADVHSLFHFDVQRSD